MKSLILIGLLFTTTTIARSSKQIKGLDISEYFVRNVPPVFTVTAAYFKLVNNSKNELKIVKTSSNCAKTVELHDVKEEDGATKMIHMPKVTVKPGETLHFKPHGKHIMLIGLTDDYHKDVPCKFRFETANKNEFSFTARRKKR
jgi:copper(I)-binding protein